MRINSDVQQKFSSLIKNEFKNISEVIIDIFSQN